MNRSYAFLLVVLVTISGCAALEDLVLGPDPYQPECRVGNPVTNTCGNAMAYSSAVQTQEPELLQARK